MVGIDGSQAARHAVAWAAQLARHLHHVNALSLYHVPGDEPGAAAAGWQAKRGTVRGQAEAMLEGYRSDAGDARIEEHVVLDKPVPALLDAVDRGGADLLSVGQGEKGAVDRFFLGSTAESLLHRARVPCLIAKHAPGPGPVCAALGNDRSSELAAAWGLAVADWLDRELILLHAMPQDGPIGGFEAGGEGVTARIVSWPPDEGLAQAVEDLGASLLVVGHGRRPAWLGSRAVKIVRKVPSSVLVARGRR